jgi:AcrR family transcriptional regulator
MARWKPDALDRLQQAALALYGERGFDQTTVAEIAEEAGLTKRTFFRYFTDKREVLFHGSQELEELLVTEVRNAPAFSVPLDPVAIALDAAATMFEQRREFAVRRQRVIAANPELQERERVKLASLAAAVAQALRLRGVGDLAAILTAETGITVLRVAFERWVDPANRQTLHQLIDDSLHELQGAIATAVPERVAVTPA